MSRGQISNYISMSDMMSGLMLVFLVISILLVLVSQKKNQSIEKMLVENQKKEKTVDGILIEYNTSHMRICQDLEANFAKQQDALYMQIDCDELTVKFNDPDYLFETDSAVINNKYKTILADFIPRYLSVINNPQYRDYISEVRIEGHTAKPSANYPTYMKTIQLSQARANAVLDFLRETSYYKSLSLADKHKLTFWFSANGLGCGRTLDAQGQYTHQDCDNSSELSRRVEFKIVTNLKRVAEELNRVNSLTK